MAEMATQETKSGDFLEVASRQPVTRCKSLSKRRIPIQVLPSLEYVLSCSPEWRQVIGTDTRFFSSLRVLQTHWNELSIPKIQKRIAQKFIPNTLDGIQAYAMVGIYLQKSNGVREDCVHLKNVSNSKETTDLKSPNQTLPTQTKIEISKQLIYAEHFQDCKIFLDSFQLKINQLYSELSLSDAEPSRGFLKVSLFYLSHHLIELNCVQEQLQLQSTLRRCFVHISRSIHDYSLYCL